MKLKLFGMIAIVFVSILTLGCVESQSSKTTSIEIPETELTVGPSKMLPMIDVSDAYKLTDETIEMLPTINDMPEGSKMTGETIDSSRGFASREFKLSIRGNPKLIYQVYEYGSETMSNAVYYYLDPKYKLLAEKNLGDSALGLIEDNSATIVFQKEKVIVFVMMTSTLSETESYAKKVKVSVTPTPFKTTKTSPSPTITSVSKIYTNSIGMEFVLIPAGEFDMGSPLNEIGRFDYESPVHRVKIINAFYMGKYEVMQKQWRDVMGSSPSNFKGDYLPVESISWNDVQDFIKKLNEKEGGNKYRLPSEAEWEYAARAGTTTRYSFGDDESMLGDYAWYDSNSDSKTHDVGQKKPNPWGLYDMHGNVWEWVQDNWHGDYNGAPTDGSFWEGGSDRGIRGGGWHNYARGCRSAFRHFGGDPADRDNILGFRLLMVS